VSDRLTIEFSRAAPVEWFDRWVIDRSLAIARLTHSPFSHVDLVLEDGNLLGASYNPRAPIVYGNPLGVAVRPPDYQVFAVRKRAVIETTPEKAAAFTQFCMDQVGKPFDREALKLSRFLGAKFDNRDWRDLGQWYCAECMARATEVSKLLDRAIVSLKSFITAADYLLIINQMIDPESFWNSDIA
jgi:hypothetical protein